MSPKGADTVDHPIEEGLIEIDGEGFYAIPDVDRIPPFLMSVVSDGDRWMFISSTGGLSAGRGDSAGAIFRYETDDRLHNSVGFVGPVTALRIAGDDAGETWTPFRGKPRSPVHRNLYKAVVGDSIIFEETHRALRLTFRYRWASSGELGFVRTASLVNEGKQAVSVDLIDGLLDVLPFGLDPSLYESKNNLTNAYKRSEIIDPASRLAVFSLEAGVVDRPEPSEVLRSTIAWSVGLEGSSVTVEPSALASFEGGSSTAGVSLLTGRPGAYLLRDTIDLTPGEDNSWHFVADAAQDQIAVAALRTQLNSAGDLPTAITSSLRAANNSFVQIMAPVDALQRTGDRVATAHQFANVTYNSMRGGAPLAGYHINTDDFTRFLFDRNRKVADRHGDWLQSLPEVIDRQELLEQVSRSGDRDLERLGHGYLPFGFSRRHGDPSRPWNAFSIRTHDEAGRPIIYYEGNWRDIFQNWEAMCMSFPDYYPDVISVFVNASTPDGFNPYRITRDGIDWEAPDPDDPWSNIGYWGDHQIVYLLRLLEAADRFLPGATGRLLGEPRFSYADVPYRIAPYQCLVDDPKETITYDESAAARSAGRVGQIGNDGKLMHGKDGEVYHVTFAEKLLVPALAKLSNFVPGGGIWMNTQRPEWNDANNALVGYGLSMVTLYHLRRYLQYFSSLVRATDLTRVEVSTEVADWLAATTEALRGSHERGSEITNGSRKELLDNLGETFATYRSRVYESGFSGHAPVTLDSVVDLCEVAIEHLDDTIHHNRRPDGLYHSYNLIRFESDGSTASISHLPEMLEGQVAAISSGVLPAEEQADVIDTLFASALYRADQGSFMLYPARQLPSFLDKNIVPGEAVNKNPLLATLLESGDRSVIALDIDGRIRFNASFANRDNLEATLDRLEADPERSTMVAADRAATLETYEQVFRHHAYTGRSGSMYGYEGIGSIYWHMVAKLLVAVQESAMEAMSADAPPGTIDRLVNAYWRVRSGLGFNKSAAEFGAIPLDPYSHTPAHSGAQQPGMTGLVKEELLTRPLEVGLRVANGEIWFDPKFLRRDELLDQPESWQIYDIDLEPVVIALDEGSLGMTFCQVPVVVSVTSGDAGIEVVFADGTVERHAGLRLDRQTSAKVFARSGEVARINARLPAELVEGT
jgi:hypothetical protein